MSIVRRMCAGLVSVIALGACSGDPVSEPVNAAQVMNQGASAQAVLNSRDQHGSRHVAIMDDCDPDDPSWAATGGCVLRNGAVTEAEFGVLLTSPLSLSVIGHPAWRMEPSYLRVSSGETVMVSNLGGRLHTFTPVALFGGGRVPPLNIGLTAAPECASTAHDVLPGGRLELSGLSAGNHRYQCCIHPWMRAMVKVE
jgi:plastocyanin